MDTVPPRLSANGNARRQAGTPTAARQPSVMLPWLQAQSINVQRHAEGLRPFRREEFGDGPEIPSQGHIQAVNHLINALRNDLLKINHRVDDSIAAAIGNPSTALLQRALTYKEQSHGMVQAVERVWDFYFELFGQRQTRFGTWLLSTDRIALDCYQSVYMGLGQAKSIPAPPPFSYMRTGFSPATFRRSIPLRRLGHQLNPFPLIQLPYHRLMNPWTLGAVLHEVGHNIQSDLGLSRPVPLNIARNLLRAGFGRFVASVWTRWNRELFADVIGLLMGGPSVVASLMDVIGRGPETVFGYRATGPHPTPYLRAFISLELLRRMGFPEEAKSYERMWRRMYPNSRTGNIPARLLDTFGEANRLVIDTVCFQPYTQLGGKSLSQVVMFTPKEQQMVEEAARRLGSGTDPGILPERFMIGAARFALDNRLATPAAITENFYKELARR
jgi:hypothetical protein